MNGVLIVNKDKNMTSRDVVNRVSKILKEKKIGHTGTLDPIATGVLILCIGKSTKLCELLTSDYKEYVASIKLGIKTDTLDITGNVIEEKDYSVNKDEIIEVLNSFLGFSKQQTPLYSAVKVNGKRLYQYARNNEEVVLPYRDINIKEIELLDFDNDLITFRCVVSKGTYIRALINDICDKLNTVGTMSYLNRTKQGIFDISNSYTLDDILNNKYRLLTNEEVLVNYKSYNIDDNIYKIAKNGGIIDKFFHEDMACLKYNDKIVAIYKTYDKNVKKAKPFKML